MNTQHPQSLPASRSSATLRSHLLTLIYRLVLLGIFVILGMLGEAFAVWEHTVIKHFGAPAGSHPVSSLVIGTDGRLYGTTSETVYAINADGTGFTTLRSFAGIDGGWPSAGLTIGADGRLYSTTQNGGASGHGIVYAINADGTGFTTLHSFAGSDGSSPRAGLTIGADGRLYGTTATGGAFGYGTVFAVNADGTEFTRLHSFAWSEGAYPLAGLTIGTNGRLYGTTELGGAYDYYGTVYAINADGTQFTTLHSFAGSDGDQPYAGLTTGADGRLYGTTLGGGGSGYHGTVYAINADGTQFTTLHSFAGSDGAFPYAGLTTGADGRLYGTTTSYGGASGGYGTVFGINADGTQFTTLHSFAWSDGAEAYAGLAVGADGRLYGTTWGGGASGFGTAYAINADGTQFTSLHSFTGVEDGYPVAGLTVGADGRLYGTTRYGGLFDGYGTVFATNADGTEFTTLHSFFLDGGVPSAGLTTGTDGRLYGTTSGSEEVGTFGTVYAINADGTGFTTLHSFVSNDGTWPSGGLTVGADGRLYGTTSGNEEVGNFGTVYAINADGTGFTTLRSFAGSDGAGPTSGLTAGADGRLYGTTWGGGASGYGTAYAINADGTGFTTLHSFAGSDGAHPYADLTVGADGRLYGTTVYGGAFGNYGYGTVYAINADGTGFTTLHSFAESDGAWPSAGLTTGANGRLYGTTGGGGASGYGTVYTINADGTDFTTLHSFAGSEGARPFDDLTTGADGRLYGTTIDGGTFGFGTLFSIDAVTPLAVTITTPAPGHLQQVNQGVGFEGFFTPTGSPGSYTAKWTFTSDMLAAPIETPGIITGTSVSCTQAFSTPGVYAVTLTVTDPTGVSASTDVVVGDPNADAFVVIYDPNGGSVTGSGTIWSPAGAFSLDPSQEGRANFGFAAKYKKGATVPGGNTDFQFKTGGLNFAMSSYQWLVVAGSNAKFKGTGMINGVDGFGIMLTTRDGGATGSDMLRIKIWDLETDEVIYDNQLGASDDAPLAASTILKGGNITVRRK